MGFGKKVTVLLLQVQGELLNIAKVGRGQMGAYLCIARLPQISNFSNNQMWALLEFMVLGLLGLPGLPKPSL